MSLTLSQLADYAKRYDFRTNFNRANLAVLSAYGLIAAAPGAGTGTVRRTAITTDFAIGAADPARKMPLPADVGGGAYRTSVYARWTGILTFICSVPYETNELADGNTAYTITADHARALDETVAQIYALYQEGLQPFTSDNLPYYDVQRLVPLEPDERPTEEREVNVAYVRFGVTFELRQAAMPA